MPESEKPQETAARRKRGTTGPSERLATMRLRGGARGRNGLWIALAALIVLTGSVGSIIGARGVAHSAAEKARLSFHLRSAQVAATLKLAIQHEEDLIVSASAFETGNPSSTPLQFDRWAEDVRAMQRYPELQDLGFVKLVPASGLPAFEAHSRREPLRPLGPTGPVTGEHSASEIVPLGRRRFYCLADAGFVRSVASEMPGELDYCAFAPTLIETRSSGESSYAPFVLGTTTTLGIETPVYRGGAVPRTTAGREREFLGWLGELIAPRVVLERALISHPGLAVTFHYISRNSNVTFNDGRPPRNDETSVIELHNGWIVQTFGAATPSGTFDNPQAEWLVAAGVIVSVLLALLVLALGTGRTRALTLVHEKTRELSHLALHDALTGLPNRALVMDRAEQMLARTSRQSELVAGALFIDIDGFKHVNDSHGHGAGDQLLKVVGDRLQHSVREQDTVGRLGGDEFVVLVESLSGDDTLNLLADRLTDVLRDPVELDDGRKIFSVTASIGVAAGPYSSPDALLRDADLALYAAKAAGKDRYTLFDESIHRGEGQLELEAELSGALQADQLFLVYQPIFDIAAREVVAVEALVRWRHPTRGIVPPDSFIPLAEENGLIIPIGRWVLDEACRQAAEWARDGLRLGISVNVSAHQLGRKGFAQDVRRALSDSAVAPELLTLEITETTLMRDVDSACAHLEGLKKIGVKVAIDDFGTGYASLSHLRRMPVDILKIDRSFVAALDDGGHSRDLLEAILGVGQALSLTVVAEGIEDDSQLNMLEQMGCERGQGFLLGRPAAADVITASLTPGARSYEPSAAA